METTLPQTMKAIVLYREGDPIRVEQIPVPVPKVNEVLIKVEASPLNPADLSMIRGLYPGRLFPVAGGIEGAGTIVAASEDDEHSKQLIGKRVGFFSVGNNGSWSEYTLANSFLVFELENDIDFNIGSCSIANPLTAIAMLEILLNEGHKAVIHNAGSSAIGKMMIKLFQKQHNITLINIVRKSEQIQALKNEFGLDLIVIDSSSPNFLNDLSQSIQQLNPTCFFDAVGGSQTGQIFSLLPPKSICYNYGFLSGKMISGIDSQSLIFNQKVLRGLWLTSYILSLTPQDIKESYAKLKNFFKESLTTNIYKTYQYENILDAIKDYKLNSSKGKIILVPQI